jgi:parvulin-like peptidyl-prolyl isomerase
MAQTGSKPMMRHGEMVITQDDFRKAVDMNVPEAERGIFYASEKRVRDFLANMFGVRQLVGEARQRRLSAEEQRILDETTNRALAQMQLEYLVAQAAKPDFEKSARETYVAYPERFVNPEMVRVEHILVSRKERCTEEAQKRAEDVLAQVKSGDKSFAAIAEEMSDDPSVKQNKGDMGFFARGKMVKPFEDTAFAMKTPGEIVGPVETSYGYHIIRFVERKPESKRPFEEVKDGLVREAEQKFRGEVVKSTYERIGKLEGVEVDNAAIEEMILRLKFPAPRPRIDAK